MAGRILAEVVSTDRTQWSLYKRQTAGFSHTDPLSLVNKMLIIRQTRKINLFNVTGMVCTNDILLTKGDEVKSNLPEFTRLLYFFFCQAFLHFC